MKKIVNKTVTLNLAGLDANAFVLLGHFSKAARAQGWNQQEIDLILEECQSKDYNHLLNVLSLHTQDSSSNQEQE
jgi:hypothetical protein